MTLVLRQVLAILILAAIYVAIMIFVIPFDPEWRYRRRVTKRAPLSDQAYLCEWFPEGKEGHSIAVRIRQFVAEAFDIEKDKLLADDLLSDISEDQIVFTEGLEREYAVTFTDDICSKISSVRDLTIALEQLQRHAQHPNAQQQEEH